jgi:hypothetical protein
MHRGATRGIALEDPGNEHIAEGGKHMLYILTSDSRLLPLQSQAAQAGLEAELYAAFQTHKPQSL